MISVRIAPYHKRHIVGEQAIITIAFPDNRPPYIKKKKIPKAFEGSKKKAEDWAMKIAVTIAKEGRPGKKLSASPPAIPTFGEFAKRYVRQHLVEGGKTRTTQENRELSMNIYLLPLFKDVPLDQIDEASFDRLRSSLQKTKWGGPRGARGQNIIIGQLYQILELSRKWKVCLAPLPERPERLKEPKPVIEIYTRDELQRLLAAAKEMGPGPYRAVLLGCEAGLRISEMVGLEWADIDPVRGVISVRRQETPKGYITPPKGGASRNIEMTELLKKVFAEPYHLGKRVIVKYDGTKAKRCTIKVWLRAAEKRAKLIRSLSPHKLRHTYASRLLARGASLLAVKALLGHASLQSTMCYLHLQSDETRTAVERLSGDGLETGKEERKS